MPVEIKYLDDELGVLFIGEGIVTGEDIINSNRQFFSSEEKIIKNIYGIFDFSNITKFEVSNAELETIISQNKKVSESLAGGTGLFRRSYDSIAGFIKLPGIAEQVH